VANNSIPPQKRMTGMLGHPVAENPIDCMFDAVYSRYGLNWQFWKCNVPSEKELVRRLPGFGLSMQIFEGWTGISPDEAVFQQTVAVALGKPGHGRLQQSA
jgi:hypothetical protein